MREVVNYLTGMSSVYEKLCLLVLPRMRKWAFDGFSKTYAKASPQVLRSPLTGFVPSSSSIITDSGSTSEEKLMLKVTSVPAGIEVETGLVSSMKSKD